MGIITRLLPVRLNASTTTPKTAALPIKIAAPRTRPVSHFEWQGGNCIPMSFDGEW
jgi:hypothetical protein